MLHNVGPHNTTNVKRMSMKNNMQKPYFLFQIFFFFFNINAFGKSKSFIKLILISLLNNNYNHIISYGNNHKIV